MSLRNAVGHLELPDGEAFDLGGKSVVADPSGHIVAQPGVADETIGHATLDIKQVYDVRCRYFMFRDRRPDVYAAITSATEDILQPLA